MNGIKRYSAIFQSGNLTIVMAFLIFYLTPVLLFSQDRQAQKTQEYVQQQEALRSAHHGGEGAAGHGNDEAAHGSATGH